MDLDETGMGEALDLGDLEGLDDLESTGMRLASDETGRMPLLDVEAEIATPADDLDLLDATGHTQILSDDMAVETGVELDAELGDDDATLALPADVFANSSNLDQTAELSAIAGTDLDLDLDDLTAALQVSEVGDTIDQFGDDATVEQPRPAASDETAELPAMSLGPEDMGDDLHDARTMTEVGTKLDLARAYVDMGDPAGARSILEEVLDEGDEGQRQQAQQLLDSLPS
jgi:pilus assembly protein FimV